MRLNHLAGFLAVCAVTVLNGPVVADVTTGNAEISKLHAVFDAHWDRRMKADPVGASMLGDRRFNRQWEDLSPTAREQQHEGDIQALRDLNKVDRELLTGKERVNFDLFEHRYRMRLEAYQFDSHLIPMSQRGGIQTLDETGNRLRMDSPGDYEDWLARLDQIDTLMNQTISLMEEGIDKGILPPKITMQRIPNQIKRQLVSNAEDSLFYEPFANMPDSFSIEEKQRLTRRAFKVINEKVIPAYRVLYEYFNETYYPACPDSIAESDRPNGKAHYEFLVRQFTTTDLSPDAVHQIGLKEVARIRGEMDEVIKQTGFKGDFSEFLEYLRTDPRFYYATADELFDGYLAVAKRIDPKLIKLFGKLPRMPYGLKKIPDAIAPDTTTAYYSLPAADGSRPGYYWVNLYKPETRPKYEMEVLSVHEAVPGHHLQLALQQELESLPSFRRYSGFTVFVEGWGLYSEGLGVELGLYKDPYSKFGQLTYDMWRAVRLVVDTGMHYKGWSRQKAIDYFKSNAAKTELDIINEIDRYISWPGQALAYKLGQLKFLELRGFAENSLGDKFDIRQFHDTILAQGAVPLSILEAHVNDWVREMLSETGDS